MRKAVGWVPANGPRQQQGFPRSCLDLHAVSTGSQEQWAGLPCALGRAKPAGSKASALQDCTGLPLTEGAKPSHIPSASPACGDSGAELGCND